ncbi:MAG: DUF3592 domain-containing protein [Bacteroidota bacterium]
MKRSSIAANYNLPRPVGLGLKLRVIYSGFFALFGTIFLLTGLFVLVSMAPLTDFSFITDLDGERAASIAAITAAQRTGEVENGAHIMKYDYTFTAADGKKYSGASYYPGDLALQPGDSVTVEYSIPRPQSSRIAGLRKAPLSFTIFLILLLFPVTGIITLAVALRKGFRTIHLLRYGLLTTGRVTGREATSMRVNRRTVYKVFFEFTGADGMKHKTIVHTHDIGRVTDEREEKLVFDTSNPQHAVLLDALPKAVRKAFDRLEGTA